MARETAVGGGGPRPREGALRVTVVNGDLSFVTQPILVGHYASARLSGTEELLDARLGGAMARALRLGLYPLAPGSNQLFESARPAADGPLAARRPRAVVVVGLGEEGSLAGAALAQSVRYGVLAWAQRAADEPDAAGGIALAATLLGSGGIGVRVGQAAQLIVQGVLEANRRLRETGLPRVARLALVELYLDRATEAWRALRLQERAAGGAVAVGEYVEAGRGALERPLDAGYRGADYDIVSAGIEAEPDGNATVSYTVSTRRARAEVRGKSAQVSLVRQMVERASNRCADVGDVGHALWDLLIPAELEPLLAGSTELQLEVTRETAGIPWEMLDSRRAGAAGDEPWAVRTKLVRKLRTAAFRERVVDADDDDAGLVIGDPLTGAPDYPPLAAARAEATAVARLLGAGLGDDAGPLGHVEPLFGPADRDDAGPNADRVIKTLFSRGWRVVHICAHGAEPPALEGAGGPGGRPPDRGASPGVVLSDGMFLGPREIASLRVVPELVFLNCCHLARGSADGVLAAPARTPYDRAVFAAGIADALIALGVQCVVAAGWAVEDEPARVFAEAFYGALLGGGRFVDAVARARAAARAAGGTTWAAYQCYGNPEWVLRGTRRDAQRPATPVEDEFAGIASPAGLRLALHTLATRSEYGGAERGAQAERLRHLERRFGARWGATGAVAEAFGRAWGEVGELARAVEWHERARAAPDGGATLRATERLADLRARLAWENVAPALAARRGAAGPELRRRAAAARAELTAAVELLRWLSGPAGAVGGPTAERAGLLGAAYKRLAMLELALGRRAEGEAALRQAVGHYEAAAGGAADGAERHRPAMNCLSADLALNAGRRGWPGPDAATVRRAREELRRQNAADPDFRSRAGEIELAIYEAVAARGLAGRLGALRAAVDALHGRAPAAGAWRLVYDEQRFVLDAYGGRAGAGERAAARALLAELRRRAAPPRRRGARDTLGA